MNFTRFFTIQTLLLMLLLAACAAPATPKPSVTVTITNVPTAVFTSVPLTDAVVATVAPTETSVEDVPPAHVLQINLKPDGHFGKYAFAENTDGYFELKDAEGNLVPDVKLLKDGTAERTVSFKGEDFTLVIAFQAISIGERGQLVMGLWEYENGHWSNTKTDEAPRSKEALEKLHKLVILRGHDKEEAMLETVYRARDMAFGDGNYDPKDEFKGINVTYNFKEYKNVDVRPVSWVIVNWSRGANGAYYLRDKSYSPIPHEMDTRTAYVRPIQVALGTGWFGLDIYNTDGKQQPSAVHVPIVMMNPDRSVIDYSGIMRESWVKCLGSSLTMETRGDSYFWFLSQVLKQMNLYHDLDKELNQLIVYSGRSFFANNKMPPLDVELKLQRLPKEAERMFIYVAMWPYRK